MDDADGNVLFSSAQKDILERILARGPECRHPQCPALVCAWHLASHLEPGTSYVEWGQ